MNEDVKKFLEEKYAEQLDQMNSAQAFANLGDVIAGQKVGSTLPFFQQQQKIAQDTTLGAYEREQERLARQMQAQEMMDLRRQALGQSAREAELNRQMRMQMGAQGAAERQAKMAELSGVQAKQLGLAQMGQKAEEQYQAAIKKGAETKEYDPTSYKDMIDATSWMPQFMKSGSAKEAEAAMSAWVEAYLRDASGAAIPVDERLNYAKPFFPQLGDTPEIIANKAELRKQKMQNALLGAGPQGMQEMQKMQQPPSPPPPLEPETKMIDGVPYKKVQGGWQKVGK
jgi:hypothetical protein